MRYAADFLKFFTMISVGCWMVSCGSDSESSNLVENTSELCKDGIDNDNDGKIDCQQDSCKDFVFCQPPADPVPENTEALCKDGIDNDNNGKTDCNEESCKDFDYCKVEIIPENTYSTNMGSISKKKLSK